MRGVAAVFRRELAGHFESPVAPVTAAVFVLALDALFFFVGYAVGDLRLPSFWQRREATLEVLFAWLPLLFVVLVPALTMGAWAEERRSGSEELLLTLPLRPRDAVLGKFLASWTLLALLVAVAVLPMAAVVSQLGELDWSAALGGLMGAVLLGASCVALGLWVSALSGDQLIAFLLAAVLLALLWSAGTLARLLPAELAPAVQYAGPSAHYLESSARGVFDARDLVYHGLLTGLGLFLNTLAVEGRRWRGAGAR